MLYSQHLGLYVCIFMHTECCCRCMCCYAAVVAAAAVLLAAVRRRVPDGKICCWFIESDSSVFFLFIQTRYILNVLLGSTVAFTASIFLLKTSSVIAGMRGAKAAVSPPRRSPTCINVLFLLHESTYQYVSPTPRF